MQQEQLTFGLPRSRLVSSHFSRHARPASDPTPADQRASSDRVELRELFLREGVQFFENLEEPRFTIGVENFFCSMVMFLCQVKLILFSDAGNLLLQTAHALANGALVHCAFVKGLARREFEQAQAVANEWIGLRLCAWVSHHLE